MRISAMQSLEFKNNSLFQTKVRLHKYIDSLIQYLHIVQRLKTGIDIR